MASTGPTTAVLFAFAVLHLSSSTSNAVGVNYGTNGNLPSPDAVANFIKEKTSIDSVKIFDTNHDILRAFADSNVTVTITVPNGDIPNLTKVRKARKWVSQTIAPFHPRTKIKYIVVGNEILLSSDNNLISNLVPAIRSIQRALIKENIKDIKVTTAHALNIIDYDMFRPPSATKFRPAWDKDVLAPNLYYLRKAKAPFMVNPYPYFGFGYDPANQNYPLFKPNKGIHDKFTNITYNNMFDALMDATYSAMKALGYGDVEIVIGETGWPSACDAEYCSPDNAALFNREVINRVNAQGTPLMPNRKFETYIFALFNEDLKPGPTAERNWGLFKPDFTPVYDAGLLQSERVGTKAQAPATNTLEKQARANRRWCVPKPEATEAQLQSNIDYACGNGVDCRAIQAGGACFGPNNVRSHAAYAMNAFYHGKVANGASTCDFGGTGVVTNTDPSYDKCIYAS